MRGRSLLAQWQSNGLLIRGFLVRVQEGEPAARHGPPEGREVNPYDQAASLVERGLRMRWRGTGFRVRLTGSAPPEMRIFWTDGPRLMRVRHVVSAVMREEVDKVSFVSFEPLHGIVYRHRFSRPLRLAVRAAIIQECPDFDYITENGDYNPDSGYAQDVCELHYTAGEDEGPVWITADDAQRFVELVAYHLQSLVQGPDPDGMWIQ